MLRTFAQRVAVRGLDAVVVRGRAASSPVVRSFASAVDRARRWVGLDRVPLRAPLPPWPEEVPDPPMWDSERKRLEKWYADMGYGKLGPGAVPVRDEPEAPPDDGASNDRPARHSLPVLGDGPRSPFADDAVVPEALTAEGEPLTGDDLVAAVRRVLETCRPLVQADGGDLELLDVTGDVVRVRLTGNCVGCPSAQVTLQQGIERRIRAALPQIRAVEAAAPA